jgi:hypothetical protein
MRIRRRGNLLLAPSALVLSALCAVVAVGERRVARPRRGLTGAPEAQ